MTARWVVDVVQPERDLNITWQPISLLFKNEPPEDSDYFAPVDFTHKLLRVFESVKAAEGMAAAEALYWQYGAVLHHDRSTGDADMDAVMAGGAEPFLEAAALDASHAAAFDDESWDTVIREKMDAGLALVGNDVGTPIIAFDSPEGRKGIFGPVISRKPEGEEGLALWDAMATMATMDGFWELKRTRTVGPDFGERP
jgi:hypothetical protein